MLSFIKAVSETCPEFCTHTRLLSSDQYVWYMNFMLGVEVFYRCHQKKGSSPIVSARYIFFFFTRLVEEPLLDLRLISPSFSCSSQCPSSVVFVCPYLFRNRVIPQAWHVYPNSECRHFVSYRTV
jgi:hypothetical protein